MTKTPICLFGEVLFDCFPDGQNVLGGAPFNVAWHLAAFGEQPLLISAVGADALGERIRAAMTAWGMVTDGLQTDTGHQTGTVAVSLEDGEPTYEIIPDRAFDHVRRPPTHPECSFLYHGTLAARGARSAETLADLRLAAGGRVFVDVNLRPPWWSRERSLALIEGAAWVKLNRDELGLLGDVPDTRDASPASRAGAFREAHGLAGVILTLGAEGAVACTADEPPVSVAPPPRTRVIDAVGAGDAFTAVTLLGIVRGWPLSVTLERAQQFAALIVGQRGAISTDRSLYAPLLEQWRPG